VLGTLDKGTSAPMILRSVARTPQLSKVSKLLKMINYRTGVSKECPHLEHFCAVIMARAGCYDVASKGAASRRSAKAYLRTLKRIERKLSVRLGDHRLTWAGLSVLVSKLKPTPTSVQTVFPHNCVSGEGPESNV
jgi:hypothetical protein